MTVEIVTATLTKGIVTLTAIDCSEENLRRMERWRDNKEEKMMEFVFDTTIRKDYLHFRKWMKQQKVTREAKTWGEALNAISGIITDINGKYRVWD